MDAMLDFQVGVALGDEPLSEIEWSTLMDSDDGLVQIEGQWVVMDRERLAAALATGNKSRIRLVKARSHSSRECVCSPALPPHS